MPPRKKKGDSSPARNNSSGNLGFEATLYAQFEESARLEAAIRKNLRSLGYDW